LGEIIVINPEMKMNEKMKILIESGKKESESKILQFKFDKLRDLFFPNFVSVADCIIMSNKSQQILTQHFDNVLKSYSDKTSYGASNTEIRVNDFIENQISAFEAIDLAFLTIDFWAVQLKNIDNRKTCFILSGDRDYITLRFHKIRENEKMWLTNSLEEYGEPVGYVIM
jgi:hypothetical protein